MKATVERAALLRALGHVQAIVERRNTIPILSNVLITAGEQGLVLVGTDLDIQVRERVAATVDEEGAVTVAAQLLHDIVRELPDGGQVELAAEAGALRIAAGRARYRLATLPPGDFPEIAAGDPICSFELPARTLSAMLGKVAFAMNNTEARYYLNGVMLHAEERGAKLLTAVATDGNQLAVVSVPRPDGADSLPGVIVPRKTVGELPRLFEGVDGALRISVSQRFIRFEAGDLTLTSKAVDGTYPDYRRVIPTQNEKLFETAAASLEAGVRRVAVIASEKVRGVKLAIERDRLTLSVTSPERGTAVEEVPGAYQAEPIEVGFNSGYLFNVLKASGAEQISLHLSDAAGPALFTNPADSTAQWVVMPLRV